MPRYVPAGGGGAGVYIDWCISEISSNNSEKLSLFNNYSPKAKLILFNNPRDEVDGIIQQ